MKNITTKKINEIRQSSESTYIKFKEFGKSKDIKDYSDKEIKEMHNGIYPHKKMLLVDDDIHLNLKDVIEIECILSDLTYYKKPTNKSYKTNSHNVISNINTFYVKDYFLITKEEGVNKRRRITRFLYKMGALKTGRTKFRGQYGIKNQSQKLISMNEQLVPEDLCKPIELYINNYFFINESFIPKLIIKSDIVINHTNNARV